MAWRFSVNEANKVMKWSTPISVSTGDTPYLSVTYRASNIRTEKTGLTETTGSCSYTVHSAVDFLSIRARPGWEMAHIGSSCTGTVRVVHRFSGTGD